MQILDGARRCKRNTTPMLTLIDNYDSFTYNLVHFLGELGASTRVYRNDKVTVDEVLAEAPEAIVLSPGPCDPDRAGICLELIERAGPRCRSSASASATRPSARSMAAAWCARRR